MIGKKISHYRILEKLGEGGMGVVYKAEDSKLKRMVALKFLPLYAVASKEEKSRFTHEAQAAARLNHPNICTIYEINESDEQPFIAMEFVEGQSLKEKIASGPLKMEEALHIMIQVSEGLEEAHKKGIVHRDIKSANIMISENGKVKITDFGLAKLAGRTQITKSGTTLGTVAYMSPEQARGESVGFSTDIWSLGVVFYEMLTGQLPFRGDHDQVVLFSILNEEPVPMTESLADVPPELESIVEKCLKKELSERYQNAFELRADLVGLGIDMGLLGSATLKAVAPPRYPRLHLSRKLMSVLAGTMIVLLLLLLVPTGWRATKKWLGFESVPDQKHLLVIPFTNIGGDPTNQAFSDGLVETLTSKLTQLEQFQGSLWVVPASEVRSGGIQSPSEARRAFGVNLVVTGSVQRMADRFRLTLNLVDANNLRNVKSTVIDDDISNVSILQDESVFKIAQMLDVELQPQTRRVLTAGGTTVPKAYEYYLLGRGYLQRYESLENLDTAIDLFKQAIEQDSRYALAYAGLGQAYWRKYDVSRDAQWVKHAVRNCERAVELNNLLAPVNVTLGLILTGTGRYEEAIKEFQQALTLDPVSADAYRGLAKAHEARGELKEAESTYLKAIELKPDNWAGYNDLGVFYYRYGRYDEAVTQFRRVIELIPQNARGYRNLGGIYFYMNRWEDAIQMFKRSLEIEPDYQAYSNLATLYFYQGRYADAARMYEKALEFNDRDFLVWGNLASAYYWNPAERVKAYETYKRAEELAEKKREVNPRDLDVLSDLAGYYAMTGDSARALSLLQQIVDLKPDGLKVFFRIGATYERLGRREPALQWIGKALEEGYSLAEIERAPSLRELRKDARFKLLQKRSKDQAKN